MGLFGNIIKIYYIKVMNKVKIIKCSGKTYWYSNEINNTYDVEDYDEEHFKVLTLPNLLLKTDVKVIK